MLDPDLRRIFESIIRGAQGNFDHFQGQAREFARQFNLLARDIEEVGDIAVEASASAQEVGTEVTNLTTTVTNNYNVLKATAAHPGRDGEDGEDHWSVPPGKPSGYSASRDAAVAIDFSSTPVYRYGSIGSPTPFLDTASDWYFPVLTPAADQYYDPQGWLGTTAYVADGYWGITFPAGTYWNLPPGLYDMLFYAKFNTGVTAGYWEIGVDFVNGGDIPSGPINWTSYYNRLGQALIPSASTTFPDQMQGYSKISIDKTTRFVPFLFPQGGAEDAALALDDWSVTIYKVA